MQLDRLWLTDFRNYVSADLVPAPDGLTVITGGNGEGKTNLLEAIGYLATLRSFRGAPGEAMIRVGAERAIVRGEARRAERTLLLEAELRPTGRDRVQVNRQPLRRTRDLLGAVQVTVFGPDDLALVKAGPQGRRDYLDDLLAALRLRHDALRTEVERILRQRNALLKQGAGNPRPPADVVSTLDVWDQKLAETGTELADARAELVAALDPQVAAVYDRVAERVADVATRYQRSWHGPLAAALASSRVEDLRRGVTTVGPHRDDLVITLGGLPSRTHASQGEQRSLALALRLAGHQVVTDAIGSAPVFLLDDVFSELDPDRAEALFASLPAGQALLTTVGNIPVHARPDLVLRVDGGKLLP
ncbi:MAG TPA: DNA replication/repair protein RecF [Acidimicrobiales bacterium]|nr:DNA replication/repair protein RecF [Acidimicrobiales bacterium]